jgi:putative peptide zinc metalloprotease protein
MTEVLPLRQELALHVGPRSAQGHPTWTVQDPSRNRFFRLDWLTFEILCHWGMGTPKAIAEGVRQSTPLDADEADVLEVQRFLARNELLVPRPLEGSAALAESARAARQSLLARAVHNYLFFRVPLARPDRLLSALVPLTGWLFSKVFLVATLGALVCGIALVSRQWDVFRMSLVDTLTPSGIASYAVALVFAKILHEFGHGIAARRRGCHVPSMGVAFMVLWPIPYTDVNEAWKLPDRRARLLISMAGVATELLIAIWATLAWSLLEDGLLRSAVFLLATTTWISTLLVNLSPFMRFDGYFALADFLDTPNLHARSFALARWRLREWLFRLSDPPPEHFARGRATGLVLFAWVVWVYRLAVFLGIALLVYAFFVKIVGIILFLIEIVWFVTMPITSELKIWWTRRADIARSPRTLLAGFVLASLLLLLVTPLPWRVQAGGMLRPGQEFMVFALESARIDAMYIRDGQQVEKDAPLFTLSQMHLDERRSAAASRVARLAAQADAAAVNPQLRNQLRPLQSELEVARASLRGLESEQTRTMPVAPVRGIVRLADPDLREGTWVTRNEPLATVIDPEQWQVDAYVAERDLDRLRVGASAMFHPERGVAAPLTMTLVAIERDATRVLPSGILARSQGGAIATREVEGKFFPEQSVYRVRFRPQEQDPGLASQVWRGTVTILAEEESVGARMMRSALAVLWREAGW